MKMFTGLSDFTESSWCSHAQILLVQKHLNAVRANMEGLIKAANCHMGGFPTAAADSI
jgi:hypothetical protein